MWSLQVKFVGEDGLDHGGVKKEYFQILTRQLFDPGFGALTRFSQLLIDVVYIATCVLPGMFVVDDTARTLWFKHDSFESAVQWELVGSVSRQSPSSRDSHCELTFLVLQTLAADWLSDLQPSPAGHQLPHGGVQEDGRAKADAHVRARARFVHWIVRHGFMRRAGICVRGSLRSAVLSQRCWSMTRTTCRTCFASTSRLLWRCVLPPCV